MKTNISELKDKGEILPATYDAIFKSIIQDENLKDFTAYIISSIIGRSIDKDSIIFVNPEFTKNNASDKNNITDILMLVNGADRISLEMNKSNSQELIKRNRSHLFEGIIKTINISYKEGVENYFIQICFDNFSLKNKLISEYKLTDTEDGIVDEENKNFIKYRINLVKIYKMYYTLDEELTRFEKALAILSFNKLKDLRKLSKGDEMLMRAVKKIEELTDDPDMVQYIDVEKGMEYGRKLDREDARNEGIKETKIETAKKMLEEKLDINLISKITGISKEEIKELQN